MTPMATDQVDALVIFGATGDLAKLETFPALVGLVERGVLDVPVVGVAKSGWGLDAVPRLRRRVADAQRHGPGHARPPTKLLGLLRYVDGDLDDDATYAAMSDEIGRGRAARCSTWRCRRRCSGGSPRASPAPAGPKAPG